MAVTNLGRIGLAIGGNFVLGKAYKRLTQVYDAATNASYVSEKDNVNIPISDAACWQKIVDGDSATEKAAGQVQLASDQADRSKKEADRAKSEADRAGEIAGGNVATRSEIVAFTADATHESIVNLYGKGFGKASSYSIFNATELTDGYVKIVFDGITKDNLNSNQLAIPTLHPDTKYTIITDILSNTNTSPTVGLLISHSGWQGGPFLEQVTIGTAQKTGIIKSLVTTENPIDVPSKLIRIMSGEAANGYIIFRQMLLEGDWTNRDLPTDYWENTYNYIGLDIKNKPDRLPENYTVTFPAPSNAVTGDKLHINGVEHLKNLYGRGFNQPISSFKSYNAAYTQKGYAEFRGIFESGQYVISKEISSSKLKPNEKYTIITDILSNTNTGVGRFVSAFGGNGDCPFVETVQHGGKSEVGIFKDIVITKTDLTNSRLNVDCQHFFRQLF